MKKRGHYCKVCGEYKANEKFSGKGHAAHICKTCAALPSEKQAEEMTLTRLVNLPWRLSKEQISWLKKRLLCKQRTEFMKILRRQALPVHLAGGIRQLVGLVNDQSPVII